jgi:hypothetical protein
MNKRVTKRKSAPENYILKFLTVSSVSSDSISAYKYAPNMESLLTQQYVCVMCTL